MDRLDQLAEYIHRILVDDRITPIHIALSMAICDLWIVNGFGNPYCITRKALMSAAKIRSKATYHKVILDLSSLGYIIYKPSYHPKKRSTIFINV